MPPTIITPDQDSIIAEIEIAAPRERVFKALTDPAQLKLWFNDPSCPVKSWQMDARVGGHYRSETEPGTALVNNVREFTCHGEITELDPPRLLVYTWFANWHEDQTRRTLVRWELTQQGSTTHVKVTHTGLAQEPIARKDYSGGWFGVVEMLKNFIER